MSEAQIRALPKKHEFFIGIDSDGCAFDAMEIKHKEGFIPNTINEWGLQAVSKFARESAEFVNLYSRSRGINRFPALIEAIELLADRDEVKARGFKAPDIQALKDWIKVETKLANPALEAKVKESGDPVLERALRWSKAVNESIEKIVHGVPPFPYVRESLQKMQGRADVMVVSATPGEALNREWAEHDVAQYVMLIAGQEMGTKKECLTYAKEGKYDGDHMLMMGDAPGDLAAAQAVGALFYPINPGAEDVSWKRFYEEGLDKFLSGQFKGDYQQKIIDEFMSYLPTTPPWKK